jgi:hypothetical protein
LVLQREKYSAQKKELTKESRKKNKNNNFTYHYGMSLPYIVWVENVYRV